MARFHIYLKLYQNFDRLCGLVVRVPGYRSRGPGFDSRRYHIFWEAVGLERGPLSLVRMTEELLEWKSSGSESRKIEVNGHGEPLRWPRNILYLQKLALTLLTSGGCSIGIVCLWTKATEFTIWGFHGSEASYCRLLEYDTLCSLASG
jgi:hypothetical protein